MHSLIKNSDHKEYESAKQEMTHFVYKLSHDLQAPLRSIVGFSHLVLASAKEKLSEQENSDMQMVIDSAKHAQALIEALLNYSRLTTLIRPPVAVDLNIVMTDVLHEMASNILKQQAIITYDPLPTLKGDFTQLRMIFVHLIDNALKFHKKNQSPIIHISAAYNKKMRHWLFRVSDNGMGIDPKYHGAVFELFKQLHASGTYEGLGIGLAFVKKIIELHQGTIGIDSAAGEGTSVWFSLPD